MKKELAVLGSMVAMSAALSSCCCKSGAEYAYVQNRQQVNATAPRVVNYKGGSATVAPVVQQPVAQKAPRRSSAYCSQVQPRPAASQQVAYVPAPQKQTTKTVYVVRDGRQDPVGIVLPAHMNYVNSYSGGYYGGYDVRYHGGCGVRYHGHSHRPNYHPPRRTCTYGTVGNKGGFLGGHRYCR